MREYYLSAYWVEDGTQWVGRTLYLASMTARSAEDARRRLRFSLVPLVGWVYELRDMGAARVDYYRLTIATQGIEHFEACDADAAWRNYTAPMPVWGSPDA